MSSSWPSANTADDGNHDSGSYRTSQFTLHLYKEIPVAQLKGCQYFGKKIGIAGAVEGQQKVGVHNGDPDEGHLQPDVIIDNLPVKLGHVAVSGLVGWPDGPLYGILVAVNVGFCARLCLSCQLRQIVSMGKARAWRHRV